MADSLATQHTLFIDVGNSLIKTCEYSEGKLTVVNHNYWDSQKPAELAARIESAEQILICSVSTRNYAVLEKYLEGKSYQIINAELLGDYIDYDTPETLGMDRVTAALGAWHQLGTGCVVVDAGTATTIDMISSEGVFSGGVIMPGLNIMEKGLAGNTDLPSVDRDIPGQWPPKSTHAALKWGIYGSYLNAVRSHIQKFGDETETDLSVVTTGGDGRWLASHLAMKVDNIDDLIFRGMAYISENVT